MKIHVRRTATHEAERICAIIRRSIIEVCESDHENDPKKLDTLLQHHDLMQIQSWLTADDTIGLLAMIDEQPVGAGFIRLTGEIILCCVLREALNRGIGTILLEALMEIAANHGIDRVFLTSTGTAKTFYEYHGFTACGAPCAFHGTTGYPFNKSLHPTHDLAHDHRRHPHFVRPK